MCWHLAGCGMRIRTRPATRSVTRSLTHERRLTRTPYKLSSAEKFAKRSEETAREGRCFLGEILQLLSERHLLAAMHFTRNCRHLVRRQIDVVSSADSLAARRGKLI